MGIRDKKVVLITGSGGGLGCDIKVDANNETVELIRRAGGEMTGVAPIDLTDPGQTRKMVEDAVAAYGGLATAW